MNKLTAEQLETLENYPRDLQEKFLSITKPCIKLYLSPEENLPLTVSKIGGFGYLPKSMEYPVNENGPLGLLAQINFAEFELLEDYPTSGLLAIYIDLTDDLYGSNFGDFSVENGYKIFYFENMDEESYSVDEQRVIQEKVRNVEEVYTPVEKECRIIGGLSQSYLATTSMEFDIAFDIEGKEDEYGQAHDLVIDFNGNYPCHQIGGFPYFTQYDPRNIDSDYDTLLFQLDSESDGEFKTLWGDYGIGNFFINREKLKKKDFSDVLYNWDCG